MKNTIRDFFCFSLASSSAVFIYSYGEGYNLAILSILTSTLGAIGIKTVFSLVQKTAVNETSNVETVDAVEVLKSESLPNICDQCSDKVTESESDYLTADTGKCGKCGGIGDCWDHELLAFYRNIPLQLTNDEIWSYLPRLRHNGICNSKKHELGEIGLLIKKCIENRNIK